MKKIFILSASALLLSVAAMAQAPASAPPPPPPVVHAIPMPALTKEQLDNHPEIAKALDNLREAEHNLVQATDTYQGHKERALELLRQAEAELIQGVIDHK